MTDNNNSTQEWEDFFYTTQDGLRLGGRKYGWHNLDNSPLLCLPGLTRNSADFHDLAQYLANHTDNPRRVLCLDYRGRGVSEYDEEWQNYNPVTEAQDSISGVLAAGLEKVSILGTSRGGLIAMIILAMRPGMITSAILNDVGPELDGPGLVRIKQYVGKAQTPFTWEEAIENFKSTGQADFPGWTREDWEVHARRMLEEKGGRLHWKYDQALGKTLDAIDLDRPIPTMWEQYSGFISKPVMAIRGENSDLLSKEIYDRMKAEIPHLERFEVPGQGHAPDVGSDDIPVQISAFLRRVDAGSFHLA